MTAMRDRLAAELARRVSQRGLVVWQDSEREYTEVAESICPPDTRFVAYEGSWYALRRAVEPFIDGDAPPRLVIYTSGRAPEEDPLEELRAVGGAYTRRLSTLAKDALAGELSEQRIAEIGRNASTLLEAEAAVVGDPGGDVRLIGVLSASDARTMALRILTGERSAELDSANAWSRASELLSAQIGGNLIGSGEDLRRSALRQMILTEIAGEVGDLPAALASAWVPASSEQRRRTSDLVMAWRTGATDRNGYRVLAGQVDEELGLASTVPWAEGLAGCVATQAIEDLVLAEAIRRLGAGEVTSAAGLAGRRLRISPWLQPQGPSGDVWATTARQWRAVRDTAELLRSVRENPVPAASLPGHLLSWYVEAGWTVDRAHRRFETARNDLRVLGALEPAFTAARLAYEQWLDSVLRAFTSAVEVDGFDVGSLVRQGDIHARWVRDVPGPVAYVWVDALRFELGSDLCEGLRADGQTAELHAAVAAVPTITPVGMANLTPGAGAALSLGLDGSNLTVRVNGVKLSTVADRVALLRAAHGDKVLDRTLDVVAGQGGGGAQAFPRGR